MKIFIFGTGEYYRKYLKWAKKFEILGLIDNNPENQGSDVDGFKVFSPDILEFSEFDRVYILSTYVNEIREQLLSTGIPEEKIFYYFQLEASEMDNYVKKYYPEAYSGPDRIYTKKIILISHDLSVTGAQNCLLQASKLLVQNGYQVIVGSPYDGDLRKDFSEAGATVIIDERLRLSTIKDIEWIRDCNIILINTVQLYYLLLERLSDISIIWWIHEPEILYKSVVPDILCKIDQKNLRIYTVSKVAEKALKKNWNGIRTANLLYGIPDHMNLLRKRNSRPNEKMRFVTTGAISELKGHDILLQAISLLSEEEKKRAEFLLIGGTDTKFGGEIMDRLHEMNLPVFVQGEKRNQDVLDILDVSDVLICPSRVETMSVAVTEGLMKELPVIVSNTCGIAEYIEDGKNGLIFQSENAVELKEKIAYCMEKRKYLGKMAKAGRETYIKNFSLDAFEERLMEILQ